MRPRWADPFPGNGWSMIYPSYIHSSPTIYPWLTHDLSMVNPWFIHGIPMIYPWFTHDIPMIYPWYTHVSSIVHPSFRSWFPNSMGKFITRPLCTGGQAHHVVTRVEICGSMATSKLGRQIQDELWDQWHCGTMSGRCFLKILLTFDVFVWRWWIWRMELMWKPLNPRFWSIAMARYSSMGVSQLSGPDDFPIKTMVMPQKRWE